MKVVLDTNVLVSGLLSPHGPPGGILRMVAAGRLTPCLDARILAEYREVLSRATFGFRQDRVDELLAQIGTEGESVVAEPLRQRLKDTGDEPFLEVALATKAECLVTGNLRHYPASLREGVKVISPAEFLEFLRHRQ